MMLPFSVLYMDVFCHLQCPSTAELENFKTAVQFGDVTWHAGPMNMQVENMNEILLGLSLNISSDIDKIFNISRKYRTLSQRDVPGSTFNSSFQ